MGRKVTARRPHKCGLCGKPIEVGIDYIQIWNEIKGYSWCAHQCCYRKYQEREPRTGWDDIKEEKKKEEVKEDEDRKLC